MRWGGFFSMMPIPQGLPPHHQLGWHGSPPACGQSESSPHCVPMPAVGHTENFSTPTLKSFQPPAQTLHDSSGIMLILHWRGKKVCIVIVERTVRTSCLALWVMNIYGEWRWGSWGRLIRLCHHILLGKSDEKRRLPATQAEGESERSVGCN